MAEELRLGNFGQIETAAIAFGDLTVFVGPQATGKSIVLQLLKLLLDAGSIRAELRRYGVNWGGELPGLLDAYFGEGMRGIWKPGESQIEWRGGRVDLETQVRHAKARKRERLFFIPAQRVLAMREGWPRNFSDYAAGDPFAVRKFSEDLRQFLEQNSKDGPVFPSRGKMKKGFRDLLGRDVFAGFGLQVDRGRLQKRLVLRAAQSGAQLPFMVWSAGQREFVPLLLGLYSIMPAKRYPKLEGLDWVVIEELEMGLHPRAISAVILLVFELLRRGYRVCLSTHSPQVLDAIWAVRRLQELGGGAKELVRAFGVQHSTYVAQAALQAKLRVYFFSQMGVVRDISELDPNAEAEGESGLGGLSEFSARASDVVARAAANVKDGAGD